MGIETSAEPKFCRFRIRTPEMAINVTRGKEGSDLHPELFDFAFQCDGGRTADVEGLV